jgi:hypothetical protein
VLLSVAVVSLAAVRHPAIPPSLSRGVRAPRIRASAPSDAEAFRCRQLVTLRSALSRRELLRLSTATPPTRALPEESRGLAWALCAMCCLLSAPLLAGVAPTPLANRLFLSLSVAVGMALQVSLAPTCIDGQGRFGQCLRNVGWATSCLLQRPELRRLRLALRRAMRRVAARVRPPLASATRASTRAWAACVPPVVSLARRARTLPPLPSLCKHSRRLLHASGLPAALARLAGHVHWNWRAFLAQEHSRQTQEWMAAQVTTMVEERKRREAEER